MKKIKCLILLIAIFIAFPINILASSTLVCELNASKEGESNLWLPIYTSAILEDKTFDIYDIAKYIAKNNSLEFIKDGNLLSFDNDSYEDKNVVTNYNNTISSLIAHTGGNTNINGRGKLKIEKSSFVYYYYYATVSIQENGYNRLLKDENGNMYHTENLGEALYNTKLDVTDFKSKADSIIASEWSNLREWNSDIVGDKPFDAAYVNIVANSSSRPSEVKYVNEEWVNAYINTNLDIVYLDDGVLFDGSKTLEDNGVVFKSEENIPDNYILKAEDVYDEKENEVEEYNEILENKMMIGLFDISVNDGVTQVDIDSGKYTIRVPITDNIKNYTGYYVVYVKDGEIVDTIDATVIDDKYIEFNTTHLSEYGIIADYLKGDVDSNGKINLQDIIILLKKYLGILTITGKDKLLGDMNNDSLIGLQDVILLLKTYLNIG